VIDEVEAIVTVQPQYNEIVVGLVTKNIAIEAKDQINILTFDDNVEKFL
jgi:hypothetical protein